MQLPPLYLQLLSLLTFYIIIHFEFKYYKKVLNFDSLFYFRSRAARRQPAPAPARSSTSFHGFCHGEKWHWGGGQGRHLLQVRTAPSGGHKCVRPLESPSARISTSSVVPRRREPTIAESTNRFSNWYCIVLDSTGLYCSQYCTAHDGIPQFCSVLCSIPLYWYLRCAVHSNSCFNYRSTSCSQLLVCSHHISSWNQFVKEQ